MTNQEKPNTIEYNKLTEAEKRIILQKGKEYPNTGEYNKHYEDGTYICRQCNQQLYKSSSKFNMDFKLDEGDVYLDNEKITGLAMYHDPM